MSEDLAAQLAIRLLEAHRRLATLEVPDDERARLVRRLAALTDASKRDLARASDRLDLLLADLDAGRMPGPEGGSEGP